MHVLSFILSSYFLPIIMEPPWLPGLFSDERFCRGREMKPHLLELRPGERRTVSR